ncbi:MAG: hypothetical protein PHG44_05950, partial [Lentisphaeria bacterium]|nr:hypothetical protein [Lentisphaeria bacterium]
YPNSLNKAENSSFRSKVVNRRRLEMNHVDLTGKIFSGGYLREDLRSLLKSKRIELGMSHANLADFFNVQWHQVRNWERGNKEKYNNRICEKIRELLQGKHDQLLLAKKYENIYLIGATTRNRPNRRNYTK